MSLSYGFYNSDDFDRRYNALQISRIFDGIITDGVYATIGDNLMVTVSEDQENILVGSGRAWFNHTWSYNDSSYMINIEALLPFPTYGTIIYGIVLQINTNTRTNSIEVLAGPNSQDGIKPELQNTPGVYQYPLAYVTRTWTRDGVTPVTASDIENTVGTSACPFVAAVIEPSFNLDDLIGQFQSQFNDMIADGDDRTTEMLERNGARINARILEFENTIDEESADIDSFLTDTKAEILSWFNNLQVQMEGNVAVNLQNQIGDLNNLQTEDKSSLVAAINEGSGAAAAEVVGDLNDLETAKKDNVVDAINSSYIIKEKAESFFRPWIYAGISITTDSAISIYIPKLIDANGNITDNPNYLLPGDLLVCNIRNDRTSKTRLGGYFDPCTPSRVLLIDKFNQPSAGHTPGAGPSMFPFDVSIYSGKAIGINNMDGSSFGPDSISGRSDITPKIRESDGVIFLKYLGKQKDKDGYYELMFIDCSSTGALYMPNNMEAKYELNPYKSMKFPPLLSGSALSILMGGSLLDLADDSFYLEYGMSDYEFECDPSSIYAAFITQNTNGVYTANGIWIFYRLAYMNSTKDVKLVGNGTTANWSITSYDKAWSNTNDPDQFTYERGIKISITKSGVGLYVTIFKIFDGYS